MAANRWLAWADFIDGCPWIRRLDVAWRAFHRAAHSPYPLQSALGLLGLGMIQRVRHEDPVHLREALHKGRLVGALLVVAAAEATLGLRPGAEHPETFSV